MPKGEPAYSSWRNVFRHLCRNPDANPLQIAAFLLYHRLPFTREQHPQLAQDIHDLWQRVGPDFAPWALPTSQATVKGGHD